MRVFAIAVSILLLCGCSRVQDSSVADARELVLSELQWLKKEPSGKAAVIFEERITKKFIQFTGRTLFVDLPHQTLSAEEMDRAGAVMSRFGVKKEVYPLGEGQSLYTQTAFQKDLGGD